jgi:hypothetical protein
MPKAILNYTTSIDAGKTAGECIGLLAQHGAGHIGIDYDGERQPCGLSFEIGTPWGPRSYHMPVNIAGTQKALEQAYAKRSIDLRFTYSDHARRVAWRVMKDWLEAQLALIEAGLAELTEIMLPWMQTSPELTMYGQWRQANQKALEGGARA